MLSLAKVARGREDYYLASLPSEDGTVWRVERPGTFLGAGAVLLELAGRQVGEPELRRLLAGRHPSSGAVLDPRHDRLRVLAFDATFSAPKSVSLLHSLGGATTAAATLAAHESAVAAVLDYLEREAARVRRSREGARQVLPAGGLVAAAFVHLASRAPDPHLHTHLLVANLAADLEGRWSALDGRPLFLERRAAGALYEAELRARLSRALGVAWRRRENGVVELAGVPAAAGTVFSRRAAAIAEELARSGQRGPRAARLAATITRPAKDRGRPLEALVDEWRQRAEAAGLAEGRWSKVAPGPDRLLEPPATGARGALERLGGSFTRSALLAVTAEAALAGRSVAELEAAVDELLADAAVVTQLPARQATLRGRGGREGRGVPGGERRPRYGSRAALAAEQEVRAALARAQPLEREAPFPRAGLALWPGVLGGADPAGQLQARVAGALLEGRPVRVVGSDEQQVAAVGALAGVGGCHLSAGLLPLLGAGQGVSLLVGAELLAPATLLGVLAAAECGRGAVVVLVGGEPGSAARAPGRRLVGEAARRAGPPPPFSPGAAPSDGRAARLQALARSRRRAAAELAVPGRHLELLAVVGRQRTTEQVAGLGR